MHLAVQQLATLKALIGDCSEENVISAEGLEQGVRKLLNHLPDTTVDVPKAPAQIGEVLGSLVSAKVADLKTIAHHIIEADVEDPLEGDPPELVAGGGGAQVIAALLLSLSQAAGDEEAKSAWGAAGVGLDQFMPETERSDERLSAFMDKYGITELVA